MTAPDLRLTSPRAPEAVACLQAYYAELAARLSSGFDVLLSADPEATSMEPPRGAFWVAWAEGAAIGCCGLKGHGDWGEVKRLWVSPSARGLGLARRFMAAVEAEAARLGMAQLRLDTNSALPEAVALYRRAGWREIPRFNDDPYPDVFFEKDVAAP
ncbi:GNAT family N-acetyltransferase [Pseudoroseicyclus tamaricis]|uniref:GNAT family N-acetyltransferase n=1 Tax=Pseudoroseicyclus tamaricis TaxID=2705421 RepID=A0A6B2JX59_9RHOB|nr:GNAT family N-acetyltransferase [Pseudoroseicyclus tamaricis]NDV02505.1 GNAT family N-acetyltransferase [Pseudoroseicyclus tamaricis]